MSDPQLPPNSAGFEEEGPAQPLAAEPNERPKAKPNKSEEMKKNLKAVFGHGVGKFSLIAVAVVVVGLLAIGVNGFSGSEKSNGSPASKVDSPRAPQPEVSVDPITETEAKRRAERNAIEAQAAAEKGASYQPGFDANIVANAQTNYQQGQGAAFNVPGQSSAGQNKQDSEIRVGAGKPVDQQNAGYGGSSQQTGQERATAQEKEKARIAAEYKTALDARDKYVNDLRTTTLKTVEMMMGASESGKGFTQKSSFTNVSYYPSEKNSTIDTGSNNLGKATTKEKDPDSIEIVGDSNKALLIKTGQIMYATLDSEINTDDGGDVLATVQGGKWSGSKLIGKIEQAPNNIRARFTILAPQGKDTRPTMRINAVALREEDAKQGIAEKIDSHTGERYFALGAASLLTGYGRAYQQTAGTTVISPGGVVSQTTTEPSNQQVIGTAVGEFGSAIGSEVRRGFNRPTTYSTPANQGFGLFFLQDVHEQSR